MIVIFSDHVSDLKSHQLDYSLVGSAWPAFNALIFKAVGRFIAPSQFNQDGFSPARRRSGRGIRDERVVAITPNAYARLSEGLKGVVNSCMQLAASAKSPKAASAFSERIFDLRLDAYLQARREPMSKSEHVRNASRIVRAAEERFAEAGKNAVSLADLCAAASVGKTSIDAAFESHCGDSPIASFYERRLATARTQLLESRPKLEAVTDIALSTGLTELGRFARDYRRLYGESPSVTLQRPAPTQERS